MYNGHVLQCIHMYERYGTVCTAVCTRIVIVSPPLAALPPHRHLKNSRVVERAGANKLRTAVQLDAPTHEMVGARDVCTCLQDAKVAIEAIVAGKCPIGAAVAHAASYRSIILVSSERLPVLAVGRALQIPGAKLETTGLGAVLAVATQAVVVWAE